MRNFFKPALTIMCLFLLAFANAQDVVKGDDGLYPSFVDFKTARPPFVNGKVLLTNEQGKLISNANGLFKNKETDQVGMEHYRYQQSFAGIPVENAVYIMHVQLGKVASQNGVWIKDFPANLKATSSINAATALQNAMAYVGAQSYKWQIPAEEAFIKREQNNPDASFYPKATLVFYSGEDIVKPSQLRLAYKLDIYAHFPLSRQIVFVDAQNGKILGKRQLIHTTNAAGTATTVYSGVRSVTTDNTGSSFRLRETGRGNGINTFNMKNAGTNYGAAVDFTDADNSWNNVNTNKDQYATDGHWATEKTYDYYFTTYNRNSVDNAGLALNSYVHTNLIAFGYGDNVNAFWDGSRMTYGDGNSTYSPLTALDIAGHEITHGVTERTSNLNYSNESGAMNEGFSDIFGTAVEFYARPERANWLIGEDIGAAFRSMSNPNQFSQPDTYKGSFWATGTADNGGVHTNSGVLNFWFYLLSAGGSGTNDNGAAYNVAGVGIDKAAAIAFRTNTVYLVPTSNYAAARTFAIKAAEDLYGVGSNEAAQTGCAFAAVGIGTCSGSTTTCNAPAGLNSSAITSSSATVSWSAAGGAVSYAVDYKTSAATTWTSATTATTATSFALTGLTASTAYNWRVKTNCTDSSSTAATASFTTTAVASGCVAAFEPNETRPTAALISSGVTNSAAISTSTDVDFYSIVTTATSNNVYNLVGPSGFDYDLFIYNSAGTQIGSSTSSTAIETVSLNSQAAGTYYIKVIGFNGANSTTCYTIKATASTATSCQSSTDTSTNGTRAGAATIPFNTNIKGLISPAGDVDDYKFVITNAGTFTITLSTLPGDYDLKLLNSAGSQLGLSENGGTTTETITFNAAAGTYYAQVFGFNGANSSSTCYTLKVQLGTASVFNTNTEPVSKALLKIFPVPAGNILNVSVLGLNSRPGILSITNVNGTVVMKQQLTGNTQALNVSKLPGGVYMVKVNNGIETISSKFVKQ
jgi:bacillolysin